MIDASFMHSSFSHSRCSSSRVVVDLPFLFVVRHEDGPELLDGSSLPVSLVPSPSPSTSQIPLYKKKYLVPARTANTGTVEIFVLTKNSTERTKAAHSHNFYCDARYLN